MNGHYLHFNPHPDNHFDVKKSFRQNKSKSILENINILSFSSFILFLFSHHPPLWSVDEGQNVGISQEH